MVGCPWRTCCHIVFLEEVDSSLPLIEHMSCIIETQHEVRVSLEVLGRLKCVLSPRWRLLHDVCLAFRFPSQLPCCIG